MLKLRRLTVLNADLITKVNEEVLNAALPLLTNHGFVIFEEAVIRANQRKHRGIVQWDALKHEMQDHFKRDLLSLSRNNFRQLTHSDYEPLRVLRDVADHLDKGNGNQTAGLGFPDWNRVITEHQIVARRHQAAAFAGSAQRLENHLGPTGVSLDDVNLIGAEEQDSESNNIGGDDRQSDREPNRAGKDSPPC